MIKAIRLAAAGAVLAMGTIVATPVLASAHTPVVSATCDGLSVDLTNYATKPDTTHTVPATYKTVEDKPAWDETVPATYKTVHHDAVTHDEWRYQKWTWSHSRGWKKIPGQVSDWTAEHNGGEWFQGQEHSDSWFKWTVADTKTVTDTPASDEQVVDVPEHVVHHEATTKQVVDVPAHEVSNNDGDPTPNHVTVKVNGDTKADTVFGSSFHGSYAFPQDGTTSTYVVDVTSYDGVGAGHWTGSVGPCGTTVVTPVSPTLAESTSCGMDDVLTVPDSTDEVTYVQKPNADGSHVQVVARAAKGYVFDNGKTIRTWEFDIHTVANGGVDQCAANPVAPVVVTDHACGVADSFAPLVDGEGYAFDAPSQNADGTWKVVARTLPGYEFTNGKHIRTFNSPYTLAAAVDCPPVVTPDNPPVVTPPKVAAPVVNVVTPAVVKHAVKKAAKAPAAKAPAKAGVLPNTGGPSPLLTGLAALLVLAGGTTTVVALRRR